MNTLKNFVEIDVIYRDSSLNRWRMKIILKYQLLIVGGSTCILLQIRLKQLHALNTTTS